jgi:DNA-binding CsgD family transcriptional regulator
VSAVDTDHESRIEQLTEDTVLTQREAAVLVLKEEGYSRHEIADALGVTPSTVDTYRERSSERLTQARETLTEFETESPDIDLDDITSTVTLIPEPPVGRERQLYQAPCANDVAQSHYRQTVQSKIDVSEYADILPSEIADQYEETAVWGTGNDSAAKHLRQGDVIAFYTGDLRYDSIAVVIDSEQNEELDDALPWNAYERGLNQEDSDTWPYVIYLTDPIPVDIDSAQFHEHLGYDGDFPLGFRRVAPHRVSKLEADYGDLGVYFEAIRETADQATGPNPKSSGSDDSTPSKEWNPPSPNSELRPFEESPNRVPDNPSQSRTQTYETNPSEKAKSHESHEDVLDLLVNHLEPEFECFDVEGGSDLIATDAVESVLQAESKSLSGSTPDKKQIRTALGQLREYWYFDIVRPGRYTNLSLTQALLFDREPSGRYREFVEWVSEESVLVFWVGDDELDGTETSMNTLRTLIE